MSQNLKRSDTGGLWATLTGAQEEFSMENRAFNYVCVISFFILLYYLACDSYIAQYLMCSVILILIFILCCLYYVSRFLKKYQAAIIIYAASSYIALILNYYYNSGISGPTICVFFLTFILLIAIGKPKQYPLWIALQIITVLALLLSEYLHPEWVPDTYSGRKDRFLDFAWTYTAAIVFIFAVINYLRKHYNEERLLAEERAYAIAEQNKHILAQNLQLEKVNDEKDKLFSIVSHDLKAPLDSILGYLELLSDNFLEPVEKKEIEAELLERTKYTSDLLTNLLSWAKVQMQGVTVQLSAIRLTELAEQVIKSKMAIAAKKGININWSIDPSLQVTGDRNMLLIILRNLVNNALKFTKPGGEILIKAIQKETSIELSVKDNGIGIPAEKQDNIFSLKTISTYGTNNEKGIGLGLRMCQEFMDYQHGKIWFESKEGAGSVFYISLPADKLVINTRLNVQ